MGVSWTGVFPAATTQFDSNFKIDFDATRKVMSALIDDGVSGLIVCGSVGENTALRADEKREMLKLAKDVSRGRVPVVSGVAEYTTDLACEYARDAQKIGIDGLMAMPPMVYSAKPAELIAHFGTLSRASDLPIMLYNNPPAYGNDLKPEIIAKLAEFKTIAAIKESSGDTRRFVDLVNLVGDRFTLYCGLDDVVLEAIMLGAVGWVSGLSNVFPKESNELFALARAGRYDEAMSIYRWFMPLLHLDARADLVQCIKLCESMAGRGAERTRPPRLALEGAERKQVEDAMRKALATKPNLAKAA
jgi:4-hydroxy-tetrahydrodipicolinate synthase